MRVRWTVAVVVVSLQVAQSIASDHHGERQARIATPRSSSPVLQLLPARLRKELIGKTVENSDGETVGKLTDAVLDLSTGRPKFAVISSGGLLGIGTNAKPVPIELISPRTAKKNIIELKSGKLQWIQAPSLQTGHLAELASPEVNERIRNFYGVPEGRRSFAAVQGGSFPTPTGRESGEAGNRQERLGLATDLVGLDVINRQQEALGEISDLLIDLQGKRPTFAIVSAGRILKSEKMFAVPLRMIGVEPNAKAVADITRQMLDQAKPFDEQAWASGEMTVYRYKE